MLCNIRFMDLYWWFISGCLLTFKIICKPKILFQYATMIRLKSVGGLQADSGASYIAALSGTGLSPNISANIVSNAVSGLIPFHFQGVNQQIASLQPWALDGMY